MEVITRNVQKRKLYSLNNIGLATFLGSAIAASFLIRQNYIALGDKDKGNLALFIGVSATLLLLIGIGMLPEQIIDKLPLRILPIIQIAIIHTIVEKIQGDALRAYKISGQPFQSNWKAAGIGIISCLFLFGIIWGQVFCDRISYAYSAMTFYEQQVEKFNSNRWESMVFYDHVDTHTKEELVAELNNHTIPKWEENIAIVEELEAHPFLSVEYTSHIHFLRKYSELRLEAFHLLKTPYQVDMNKQSVKLEKIYAELDSLIEANESP